MMPIFFYLLNKKCYLKIDVQKISFFRILLFSFENDLFLKILFLKKINYNFYI